MVKTAISISIGEAVTSLLRDGPMYSVGVDAPGTHKIEVRFFQGREPYSPASLPGARLRPRR